MDLKWLVDRFDQALRTTDRPRRRLRDPDRTTANSSPPSRAQVSISRMHAVIRLATAIEQIVAGEVAERIVDVLEVVEIDQQQGHRLRASARLGDGVLQAVVQQDPIGQAGQRVVVRHVMDLLFGPLALGDVVEHPDEAVGRALGPRHRGGGKQDRESIAGASAQPGLDAFAVHRGDAWSR